MIQVCIRAFKVYHGLRQYYAELVQLNRPVVDSFRLNNMINNKDSRSTFGFDLLCRILHGTSLYVIDRQRYYIDKAECAAVTLYISP